MRRPITIAVTNNKGGTGKTTTTLNLGVALARRGFRVLLVDLDSQCNLSLSAGTTRSAHHIGELLLGEATWEQTLVKNTVNPDLLPSSRMLLAFEYRLNTEPDSGYFLLEQLQEREYDYVLVDCPPSLGALTMCAMVAADWFIVPMQGENFAYIGLDEILQLVAKIRRRMNPRIRMAGILMNRFDLRTKFGQMVHTKLGGSDSVRILTTAIRQDVSLMECTAFGQNIFEYAPLSRGAQDFERLGDEIIELTRHHGQAEILQ
jgi:chromosome partitioning protein